jgi:alkanesulfonate monooxygenase SsuD/methylene tetrahydromethanopterin reductase-like flavin-dependent oxidoreductase (luciferase family)
VPLTVTSKRKLNFAVLLDHQFPRAERLADHLDALIEITELARDLKFDGVFGIHHFLAELRTPQPFPLLARLIPHSGTMDLGTSVYVATLSNPVQIAEELATLDQLSRGRLIFGTGVGYREEEFESFGIPRSTRGSRFVESLQVIRGLWSNSPFTFQGKHFMVNSQRSSVGPYDERHIPFWIGANAPETITRAARIGDAWIASPNVKERWAIGNLEAFLTEKEQVSPGSAYESRRPICRELLIADSDKEAKDLAERFLKEEYIAYSKYDLDHFVEMFDDLMNKSFLVGSPATIAAKMRPLVAGGFDYFIFRFFWSGMPYSIAKESLRRFSTEVVPLLREG